MSTLMRKLAAFRRGRDGAVAIEFAFVFPIVLGAMCGIIFFGTYLFNVHRVDEAARLIARDMMLIDDPKQADLQATLDAAMAQYAFPNEVSEVTMATRADGTKVAVITVGMTMVENTPFIDTKDMAHVVTLRAPLHFD